MTAQEQSEGTARSAAHRDLYRAENQYFLGYPTPPSPVHHRRPGGSVAPPQLDFEVRGREALITELDRLLQERPEQFQVLCGLGGSGKTTVAARLARLARERRMRVWWVQAGTASTLEATTRNLASRLGAAPGQIQWEWDEGNGADLVWDLLGGQAPGWLLVVDGADDVRLLSPDGGHPGIGTGWIRAAPVGAGVVVVTSRDRGPTTWGPHAQIRHLDHLDPDASACVLLDRAGSQAGTMAEARALGRRLGGLPLALHIVGKYLHENSTPWPLTRHRPREFASYMAALDKATGADPVGLDLTAIVRLTLDLLVDLKSLEAEPVLGLLSCYADGEPIPYLTMLDVKVLSRAPGFPGGIDESGLERAIKALDRFGLLTHVRSTVYTVTVHPTVGETVRRSHTRIPTHLATAVACLSQAATRLDPESPADWPTWQLLVPHLVAAVGRLAAPTTEARDATGVVARAMHYALHAGRYSLAEDLHTAVRGMAGAHPPDANEVLDLRYAAAQLAADTGDLARALAEHESLLAAMVPALGDDHARTLDVRHALAWLLAALGGPGEAYLLYQKVLVDRERRLGPDHADVLKTRHNIAAVLDEAGEPERARVAYESVLYDRQQVLGPDHWQVLNTRAALAGVRARQGDRDSALESYREVVADQRRVLGGTHPETLRTRHKLAALLTDRGDLEEARQIDDEVLDGQRRVLGADHPDTLSTRHDMALAMADTGNVDAARDMLAGVLADRRRVLGADHPATLRTRDALEELERNDRIRQAYPILTMMADSGRTSD